MDVSISKDTTYKVVVTTTTMIEVESIFIVKCCCCELMEECTQGYIASVEEKYEGDWICGLCDEAVKEERLKSKREKMITTNEALKRHMKFCQKFRSSSPPNNTSEELILVMKHILFRTLDSPRKDHGFNCRLLGTSQSCFSTIQGTTTKTNTHLE
ncbi:hypothetical protein Lal_00010255 [Lupinus albus]|uniref:Uncharacterized protein n=1 Tax=Lupinus albus TaxID=3870 RepID=A0A6A5LDX7_LUPAL|nr:hypothetical protein Lalb_Chr24g0393691 [Lupinus albus]KAF1859671.1 hypothetical protein Lal_00010255 [Lupinus albus]